MILDNNTDCRYCELPFSCGKFDIVGGRIPTRDHFIPVSKGGKNYSENIFIVCSYCNTLKGNFLPEEFLYWLRCKIEWKEYPSVQGFTYNKQLLETVKKNVRFIYDSIGGTSRKASKIKDKMIERAIETTFSANNSTPKIYDNEYQLYLQYQTPEQLALAKVHGWRIAKMLTAPEENFHLAD